MAGVGGSVSSVPSSAAVVVQSSSFSTTFTADENPLSQGSKWLNGATDGLDWGDFKSNAANSCACAAAFFPASPPPYSDAIAILKSSAFACPADQYAQTTIFRAGGYNPVGTHETGLLARFAISAHSAAGYEWYFSVVSSTAVIRWNGAINDFTPIISVTLNTTPADGDVMRLEVQGNAIRCYQNGSLVGSGTDNTFATGQTGMQAAVVPGGTLASYGSKLFSTGGL
jgi:hypothetical protein